MLTLVPSFFDSTSAVVDTIDHILLHRLQTAVFQVQILPFLFLSIIKSLTVWAPSSPYSTCSPSSPPSPLLTPIPPLLRGEEGGNAVMSLKPTNRL